MSAILILIISSQSCELKKEQNLNQINGYSPVDLELHNLIVSMDEKFFEAYNNCDLLSQADMYSDSIEFFHDKGGLTTSKKDILDATESNICGKVTRELVEGSVEVYPINNYGAVQIGFHKFHNNQEPDAESKPSKFIVMWKNENQSWRMTKVISLH